MQELIPFEPDIWIRASSLATLFDCPERWAAQHPQLGNMRMPSSAASAIGTAVHAGTAIYDMARMIRIKPSADDAVGAAVDSIQRPEEEVIWDDFNQKEATSIASKLTLSYCAGFSMRFEFDAVELPMDHFDVTAANGLKIRFTGHVDRRRVVRLMKRDVPGGIVEMRGICDLKTGKKVIRADGSVNTQVSGAQMAVYELLELMSTNTLGKVELLPAMIFGFPTIGKHQPQAAEIKAPHRLLIGDANNKSAIDIAADMIKGGNYYGNARSMLCSARYCPKHGNCRWQSIGENVYDD